jgi:tetratricopeptide (TPR) repeat protein
MVLLLVITLILLVGAVAASLLRGADLFKKRVDGYREQLSIGRLWEEGRYAEIADIAEARLEKSPVDTGALLYSGYAHFYMAISRLSAEERLADLEKAITRLRLLKALDMTDRPERIDYILGKSYLLKGAYWADLAALYLESSLTAGYLASDSYEFIGRAHSALGNLEIALEWYAKAAESYPTDRLFLTLGREAFQLGRYNESESYYLRGIEETRDEALRKRGLSELGRLYYDVGNYARARDVLEELVILEPNDPEIHFLIGETYLALEDEDSARRSWFRVTRIDPGHVGALRRLYD